MEEQEIEDQINAPTPINFSQSQQWAIEKQGNRPTLLYPFFKFDNPIMTGATFMSSSNGHRRPGTAAFKPDNNIISRQNLVLNEDDTMS